MQDSDRLARLVQTELLVLLSLATVTQQTDNVTPICRPCNSSSCEMIRMKLIRLLTRC